MSTADGYRALSMAYATGTVPEVIIRTVKVKEVPRHIRQREALERSSKPGKAEFARKLRKNMTEAEQWLWSGGLCRFKEYFYPQGVVHGYIADFLCLQYKVIIEVDGEYHESPEQQEYDKTRTENLRRRGIQGSAIPERGCDEQSNASARANNGSVMTSTLRCNKPTPNGPCILDKNHANPREVYAPCTIESYSEGSAIEQFACFGLPEKEEKGE
jgi:very-short-patch-repair endonuclease